VKNAMSKVKVKYETLLVIWAALLMSQVMFLIVVYFVKPELFTFDFSQPYLGKHQIIVVLFAVAAIAVFILSFVLRNQYIRRSVIDQDAGCIQTGLVLGCALSELSSLLGVVLAFVFYYHYFFFWIALGSINISLRRRNLFSGCGV
jgi:hypothetical protein